jgi:hypothetical protein
MLRRTLCWRFLLVLVLVLLVVTAAAGTTSSSIAAFGKHHPLQKRQRRNKINMLLRVRSNVGTWKIQDLDDEAATVHDILQSLQTNHGIHAYQFEQPLSMDPSGKSPLDASKTLKEHVGRDGPLKHGSMIYCRVDQTKTAGTAPVGTGSKTNDPMAIQSAAPASASKRKAATGSGSANNAIDLLDSDSDTDDAPKKKAKQKASSSQQKRVVNTSTTKGFEPLSQKPSAYSSTTTTTARILPPSFSLATYNVWFGPPDPTARQVHPEQRMAAIAQALDMCHDLAKNPLLFVGFQEITSNLEQFLKPRLIQMGYKWHSQQNIQEGSYGCAMAIHSSAGAGAAGFVPYRDSCQGRGILYARTRQVLFCTTHLESFADPKQYTGAKERQVQLIEMEQFCQEQLNKHPELRLVIFAGDLNWDDERVRSTGENKELLSLLPSSSNKQWVDAWLETSSGGSGSGARRRTTPDGYTYDGRENPMLGGSLRRRFDRCLLLARNKESLSIERVEMIGKEAIPGLVWNKKNSYTGTFKEVAVAPSDHFGLVVTVSSKVFE